MTKVIVAAAVLLALFLTLMAVGGDKQPRRSDEEEAKAFMPGSGMNLLGVLTAPFAPRVTLEPALIDVPPAGRTLQVPPQTHDRQVLRLLLVRGGGVSAVLSCADEAVCGKPLCLALDGQRASGCDADAKLRADGSLIVPRAGGKLTLTAHGTPAVLQAQR
jgi:hypothetical protein